LKIQEVPVYVVFEQQEQGIPDPFIRYPGRRGVVSGRGMSERLVGVVCCLAIYLVFKPEDTSFVR
jgi:hypothetical protein